MASIFKRMKTYIYVLLDPRDRAIRYVGKTVNPKLRYRQRYSESATGRHKRFWLDELYRLGLDPIMQIVEVIEAGWENAEQWWITHLRKEGHKLVNGADGGAGAPGRAVSEATRAKLREAARQQYANWSPEQREEHRLKSTRKHTPEEIARQKQAQMGHPVSAETREKLRQANKGKLPSEAARKHIANYNRSEQSKAYQREHGRTLVLHRWAKQKES